MKMIHGLSLVLGAAMCCASREFYAKADEGGGGGGAGGVPGGAEKPKTLAEAVKLLEASEVAMAAAAAAKEAAEAALAAEKGAKAAVEAERDTAKADAAAAIASGQAARKEADDAKARVTAVEGERDQAKALATKNAERVSHLEGLCQVRGVDPNAAITQLPEQGKKTSVKDWDAKLAAAKTPKERAQVNQEFAAAVAAGTVEA